MELYIINTLCKIHISNNNMVNIQSLLLCKLLKPSHLKYTYYNIYLVIHIYIHATITETPLYTYPYMYCNYYTIFRLQKPKKLRLCVIWYRYLYILNIVVVLPSSTWDFNCFPFITHCQYTVQTVQYPCTGVNIWLKSLWWRGA